MPGLQLIRSLIDSNNLATAAALSAQNFMPTELPCFQFFADHIAKYKQIPSLETMRENGLALSSADELPESYLRTH